MDLISKDILEKILDKLSHLQSTEDIKILFACESGSRAWGFPSEDSDYDVRFIYIRKPEFYLSIDHQKDVIEHKIEDNLDLSGWDIKKALTLFKKSNPPLLEWLNSPIIYFKDETFYKNLIELLPIYFSPKSCMFHYLSMAENNILTYLNGEQVIRKKYFYALRPILACI
ncbi:MAG: nucleotidyltransferase domain-containing protein [Ignavibacterium sp.]|nr:nucleotidyltransferase domain-containing protein [Ignavibacterium sp.]MDW8375176.1 nucleotidyltransferase domain-containing protein [Ignavibacteriales bacterium]